MQELAETPDPEMDLSVNRRRNVQKSQAGSICARTSWRFANNQACSSATSSRQQLRLQLRRAGRIAIAACWLICGLLATSATAQSLFAQETEPASETSNDSATAPEVAKQIQVDDVTSDEAIEARLLEILKATGWFTNVSVKVESSVAFLDGTAADSERKNWARDLARNTEGVAAVVNRLQVNRTIDLSGAVNVVVDSIQSLWKDFLAQSPLIIAGLIALLVTALVNRLLHGVVSRVCRRSRLRISLQDLLLQLVTIGVWIVGLLLAAVIVFPGLTPSKALAVLGIGSVAIGFAFKDIFENFFAGVLILWKYPFDKGDFVACDGLTGRIEEITIRMTMIRQVDGQLVVVPNAFLFKNPVDVLTSRRVRRMTVICGVAYDTDLEQARGVLEQAVRECSTVRDDPPIEIFAQEFADSSINFEVTWWTGSTPLATRESRDEVVRNVKRAFDEAGIEIPFPQRTLWLPEPVRTQEASTATTES